MIPDPESPEVVSVTTQNWANLARTGSFWFLVGILAWAPFPLGSNREWSWSLLIILVAICWLIWGASSLAAPEALWRNFVRMRIPIALAGLALVWAFVQALPVAPSAWDHPIWGETSNLLGQSIRGTISLNPWRTLSEINKLLTYLAVAWITYSLCRNPERARYLLNSIIAVGAGYAIYGFVMGVFGKSQYSLFYSIPTQDQLFSGPFVLHNSFATFEGLAAVAALARLVELAEGRILASKGLRRWAFTVLQFSFGSTRWIVIATILTISALAASASRAGVFSTLCGFVAMALPFAVRLKRRAGRRWALVGAGSVMALLVVLVWISGDTLTGRYEDLIDAGNADPVRIALWSAARRMIASAPLLGLGLGTFQDAYPIYATQIMPYIMDKAHSDYLEFAAGLGLPAALCWWGALVWAAVHMARGVFDRNRDRIYPLVGLGVTILLAVHSTVDFSLQIPAVATTYAAMLGLGLAQARPTRGG